MNHNELIKTLGQKYCPEILESAKEPKSAEEISNEANVPIGTTYRRINDLTDVDLLSHKERVLTDDRRRKSIYQREIKKIQLQFNDNDISVSIKKTNNIKNELDDVWKNSVED